MIDFNVFDNSAISILGLRSWLDVPEIAEAEPHVLITKSGYLVDWFESQTNVFQSLRERCLEQFRGDRFWGPYSIKIWHENHELVGNVLNVEHFNQVLATKHPNAFGDITNQAEEYSTITVYAPEKIISRVMAK